MLWGWEVRLWEPFLVKHILCGTIFDLRLASTDGARLIDTRRGMQFKSLFKFASVNNIARTVCCAANVKRDVIFSLVSERTTECSRIKQETIEIVNIF